LLLGPSIGYTPELKLFLVLSVNGMLLQLVRALAHITARNHCDIALALFLEYFHFNPCSYCCL